MSTSTVNVNVTVGASTATLADGYTFVRGDWDVTVASTEEADASAIQVQFVVPVDVTFTTTESDDASAFIAAQPIDATIAPTETDDASAIQAVYIDPIFVTIGSTEGDDSATFVAEFPFRVTLASSEESDTSAIIVDNQWEELIAAQRAQIIYRAYIEAAGQDRLEIRISSWQATLQTGRSNYVQAVVPGANAAVLNAINARAGGDLVIVRAAIFPNGTENQVEMARVPFRVRTDRGARRETATISGNSNTFPTSTDTARTLEKVQTISHDTGYRVRAGVDWRLRPGMEATADGNTFTVSYINYIVNRNSEFMEVGERQL